MSSRRVPVDFSWYQYYELAQQLFEDSKKNSPLSESMLRSSISRAYFASHCLARNFLRDVRELAPPIKKTHSWVINTIKDDKDSRIRKIHAQLNRLRIDRNSADYSDSLRQLYSMAEGALIGARQTIDILDEF